jgi:hypothetical protein
MFHSAWPTVKLAVTASRDGLRPGRNVYLSTSPFKQEPAEHSYRNLQMFSGYAFKPLHQALVNRRRKTSRPVVAQLTRFVSIGAGALTPGLFD